MKNVKTCFNCKCFESCGDNERVEKCNGYTVKHNGLLYDPEFKNDGYNLPIYDNDAMLNGFSFSDFIDIYVANNGRENVTAQKLYREFSDCLNMQRENAFENFQLCLDGILKEFESNK